MAKKIRNYIFIYLLYAGLVKAKDVDLGSVCQSNGGKEVNCEYMLNLNSCGPEDLSGYIFTPNFPSPMIDNTKWGQYKVVITSCADSVITLTFKDEEFFLGTENNYLSAGDGTIVDASQTLYVRSSGSPDVNELPGGVENYTHASSANSMWMKASIMEGFAAFKIGYEVVRSSFIINNYNESSGVLKSPEYGSSYPSDAIKVIYLIDVEDAVGEYVDLNLTINEFDIKGVNGDFVKIGPGLNYTEVEYTTVLSWQVNKGRQFLIDGPRANVVLNVMSPENTDVAKGFSISYAAINKTLTTPAPTTVAPPTNPTPLPLDPSVLLTDVVYLNYVNSTARAELFEVLLEYANTPGMLEAEEIVPNFSESNVHITKLKNCYHGWNVNLITCGQVQVIVDAFYRKNGTGDYYYAFPRETVQAAIRMYGYKHEITLPEDLLDIYWLATGIAGGVILLILLGLFILWRQKVKRDYSQRSKYQEIQSANTAKDVLSPMPTSSHFEVNRSLGHDNPNFIADEDDRNDRDVMTYDPDKGTFYNKLHNLDRVYPPTTRKRVDSVHDKTAVLHVSSGSSNFQWQNGSRRDGGFASSAAEIETLPNMSSIMPPIENAPKRGILKTNSMSPSVREFPKNFTFPNDKEEVVLFDNNLFKPTTQQRYSLSSSDTVASSATSSRNNSISTNQQITSHVMHGISLAGVDWDEENETNL